MRRPRLKSKQFRKQQRVSELDKELEKINLLNSWIQSQKPDSGSNPMSLPPLPRNSPVGRLADGTFSRYAGVVRFDQLPISKKTKDALISKKTQKELHTKFVSMTDIQRASLPHALCGRDVLGAAKTGSGKTLAFIIPVLEKLYRERWGSEDGVGSIIISPTRELASQIFGVLKAIGEHHGFSAGLLIGGRRDVAAEKECVNKLNVLICTPGRLLQHMDETPNFDCSQMQVLVLDEADRILDSGFKKEVNAIISQLPKHRQTMLFSATQTKSVQDLARLSLKDPEYISVHEESVAATPTLLMQTVMIVPLDQKLDMLWTFIKKHLQSKTLVFLSSCKQVKFVFEAFKKLHPGIPLKCLHGRMKQEKRMAIYSEFCEEKRSVLFSTDVAARGLDFNKAVDWVVQVDCPENVASYIHRVGRTARYKSDGKSVLFLLPSETMMLEKLKAAKVPVHRPKPMKELLQLLQPVSSLLASLLVKYPELQQRAQRAFVTYLRSIHLQKDKEIFDVLKLPIDEYSASLGLPMTPKIRFLNQKIKSKSVATKSYLVEPEVPKKENVLGGSREKIDTIVFKDEEFENDLLHVADTSNEGDVKSAEIGELMPATRLLKKKKLKINTHRPLGSRVVFDDEGNTLPPLARIADPQSGNGTLIDPEQKAEYYKRMREDLKKADKEDKLVERQRLRDKKFKQKMKWKAGNEEEEDNQDDTSGSEGDETVNRRHRKSKIYFDSDSDEGERKEASRKQTEDQEELALKLLQSMH